MHVVQVVRRFGPVGGMESYVWHLSRELVRLGCRVTVICEERLCDDISGVSVLFVQKACPKPRWLALMRFSELVRECLESSELAPDVIHSHERTAVHQVTTFHGPPFAHVKNKPIWRLLSIRIWAHLWLERRELLGPQVQAVIPNSRIITNELEQYYPAVKAYLRAAIPPGVISVSVRAMRQVPAEGGVIGFVGKEWKRKGLDFAFEVFKLLRQRRPHLRFVIIGPENGELSNLSEGSEDSVQVLGWKDATPYYRDMDLLLHPAKQEPFGMVVIEAMAARVPVVISDNCGAADYVTPARGETLALSMGVAAWVDACDRQLSRVVCPPRFERGWDQVAKEYLKVYESLT